MIFYMTFYHVLSLMSYVRCNKRTVFSKSFSDRFPKVCSKMEIFATSTSTVTE